MTFRIILDVAAGVALACVLLTILILDRIGLAGTPKQTGPGQYVQTSTLLGDPRIAKQIQAIGDVERLEKLKVVRLTSKATFATATNVNDLTLSWCWEPTIVIRFQEDYPADRILAVGVELDRGGDVEREKILQAAKSTLVFPKDGDLERRYDEEFRAVYARRDYASIINQVVLLEGKEGFSIFNKRLAVPLKPADTTAMRNLCFALSISNLVPVRRLGFDLQPGEPVEVRGRKCNQFTVKDKDGASLQFYFDEQTNLLTKISHVGHDPKPNPFRQEERLVLWEHYFSDYREVEGVKQWHHLEAHNDGQPFATLNVTKVEFFDNVLPELRRPGK